MVLIASTVRVSLCSSSKIEAASRAILSRTPPDQEIHDHVDHDLHGPLQDGVHRHAEGPQRHPEAFAWCPLLQELVDSDGELLSEGLPRLVSMRMSRLMKSMKAL